MPSPAHCRKEEKKNSRSLLLPLLPYHPPIRLSPHPPFAPNIHTYPQTPQTPSNPPKTAPPTNHAKYKINPHPFFRHPQHLHSRRAPFLFDPFAFAEQDGSGSCSRSGMASTTPPRYAFPTTCKLKENPCYTSSVGAHSKCVGPEECRRVRWPRPDERLGS